MRTVTVRPRGINASQPIVKYTISPLETLAALFQIAQALVAVYDKHGSTSEVMKADEDGFIIMFRAHGAAYSTPIIDVTVDETPDMPDMNPELQG